MKRSQKLLTVVLAASVLFSMASCTGSGNSGGHIHQNSDASKPEYIPTEPTSPIDPGVTECPPSEIEEDIIDFTMYINYVSSDDKDYDNDIKEAIASKTGVRVEESYLVGLTADEAISAIIASGKYPDYIDAGDSSYELYQNGVLIAWDSYLEMYPELKSLYTDEEWDMFRQDDGHIYWANVFERYHDKNTATTHNSQAFWIQVRVLEWAGYPKIETLDEYFDLLERYAEANPVMPDGTEIIPYTCLCEDWRYFCIESAPMYLDGYPNNGCVNVSVEDGVNNPKVIDYNTTETAKNYFRKLNEEYYKGIVDPDFAVQTYDEYTAKLCSGRVLGMCDQYWDFAYNLKWIYDSPLSDINGDTYTLSDIGCDYVPLGLVAEKGMENRYHDYDSSINTASGIAVTTSCIDPDRAFKFLNDLLTQEIHDLRFWGIEGEDYLVDSNGLYYRTPEMRDNWSDNRYKDSHTCEYSYMPQWKGMSHDGFNRMMPSEQPAEFKSTLPAPVVKCFEAYAVGNYVEMLGSVEEDIYPWYPLWTWSNLLTDNTASGRAWQAIGECKHEWLPKVVLSPNFDDTWAEYMEAYKKCNPQVFIDAAQAEVENRI